MDGAQRQLDEGEPNPGFLILVCLADAHARTGEAIIRDIEAIAGVRLDPDALCSGLGRLARRGIVEPLATNDPGQPYRITGAGAEIAHETFMRLANLARNRLHTGNRSVPLPFRPGEIGQDAVMGSYEAPFPLYRAADRTGSP
ncbi:MAG: hypothetical protein AB1551_01670 [Actinomycetota bacterium]